MGLLKPVSALRILAVAVMVLLIASIFMARESFATGFCVGAAIGLSVGVQVMVWNKRLHWREEGDRDDAIQMNLR